MNTRILPLLLLLFGCHLLLPTSARAQEASLFQELGVFSTAIYSDHPEMPSPMGFGAFARWQIARGWLFRLSYHRTYEFTEKLGTVCDQYSQRINCRTEPTETDVTFSGLRGSLSRAFQIGQWLEMGMGGGLSFNHVKPEAVDLTGWEADMLIPNTGQIGYLTSLSATVAPLRSLPILVVGGLTGHWVDFNGCSGEDPPQYDPFCGWTTFKEVELGLSLAF
jgi:hypothetical protein